MLDPVLPRLSHAADHGLLWWGVATALGATRGRRRRAAVRGLVALAIASGVANGPAKVVFRRNRPATHGVPIVRRLRRELTTFSFPSGHSASAAAFATAVALDAPGAAVPVALLAGTVAFSRVYVGAHYPSDVVAGVLLGAAAGVVTTKVMPRRPPAPARARSASAWAPSLPDGDGLTVVVNGRSGSGHHNEVVAFVRRQLPRARVVKVEPDADLGAALTDAAGQSRVLGVAGGDGTVNTAAALALAHGLPLAVFPVGTLNHFAADLGLDGVGQTVRALQQGSAVAVDVGRVDGSAPGAGRITGVFVNTASLGGYPDMVAIRERFERSIGKWPAMIVALVWILRNEPPIDVEIDGVRRRLWLVFVGNGVYQPDGFAPTYRHRLDEGLLDVRLIDGAAPFARTRLVCAVLTGRLGRSRVYEQRAAERVLVSAVGEEPLPFARDGEVEVPVRRLVVTTNPACLVVFRSHGSDDMYAAGRSPGRRSSLPGDPRARWRSGPRRANEDPEGAA
jgi:undecaprenyl-diphosphatase